MALSTVLWTNSMISGPHTFQLNTASITTRSILSLRTIRLFLQNDALARAVTVAKL